MAQQGVNPEDMSAEELRVIMDAELNKNNPEYKPGTGAQPRDEQGRFASIAEELEAGEREAAEEKAKGAPVTPVVEPVEEDDSEPDEFIIRQPVDLEDGSGVQVFIGRGATELEATKDLNQKLVVAQANATKKIRELNSQRKVEDTKTEQQKKDEEYIVRERMKSDPVTTAREIAERVWEEKQAKETEKKAAEQAAIQKSLIMQEEFVASHPDYVKSLANGNKMRDWVKNSGYAEFTEDNLEKAFESLKSSGLLELPDETASATTEDEAKATERIAQPTVTTTQTRSPKKSSTVSSRGGAPVVKTGTSLDELEKMSLEELRVRTEEHFRKMAQGQ